MSTMVIPLETKVEDDNGWGQYIKIDILEEPVSNLAYLTTSLVDLEEGNLKKSDNKSCKEFCIIC